MGGYLHTYHASNILRVDLSVSCDTLLMFQSMLEARGGLNMVPDRDSYQSGGWWSVDVYPDLPGQGGSQPFPRGLHICSIRSVLLYPLLINKQRLTTFIDAKG